MKNKISVIVSIMGVLAMLCTLFIWLALVLLGTFSGMGAQSGLPFFLLMIPGVLPALIGRGILKRRPWARIALLTFWILASLVIFLTVFAHWGDRADNPDWASDTVPGIVIGLVGIFHVVFLRHRRVKELFG